MISNGTSILSYLSVTSKLAHKYIAMENNIKKAYSVIDSVMQEVFLDEEHALQGICFLLESENLKFKSKIIDAVISVLRQWNKIPVNEIKEKVDEIKCLTKPDKVL